MYAKWKIDQAAENDVHVAAAVHMVLHFIPASAGRLLAHTHFPLVERSV